MNEFEQKLLNLNSVPTAEPNADEFLSKLHGRIEKSKRTKQTLITSMMMLMVMAILSYSQPGVLDETKFYYTDTPEDFFETDFWTLSTDSLDVEEAYTDDLAYFLLQEGDFWETMEFFNELDIEKETS